MICHDEKTGRGDIVMLNSHELYVYDEKCIVLNSFRAVLNYLPIGNGKESDLTLCSII